MGKKYSWEVNPIRDYFIRLVDGGVDLSDKEIQKNIFNTLTNMLEYILNMPEDATYLDFNIKINQKKYYKIIANNMLSALWLSGIFVGNIDNLIVKNKLKINKTEYSYNPQTKRLTIKNSADI